MKIITMSEEMGLIYYTAKDYKHNDVFVVVYGLQVKQFYDQEKAQNEVRSCLDHYWESSK